MGGSGWMLWESMLLLYTFLQLYLINSLYKNNMPIKCTAMFDKSQGMLSFASITTHRYYLYQSPHTVIICINHHTPLLFVSITTHRYYLYQSPHTVIICINHHTPLLFVSITTRVIIRMNHHTPLLFVSITTRVIIRMNHH